MKRMLLLIIILPVFTLSCLDDFITYGDYEKEGQEIFFEYIYINYAWGFNYKHWIIDQDGKVRIPSQKDTIIFIDPLNLNDYTMLFDSVVHQVDTADFNRYTSYIAEAATGKIDTSEMHMADFGGMCFSCFFWNGNNYEKITISSLSDILKEENTNKKAKEIDQWLKAIDWN